MPASQLGQSEDHHGEAGGEAPSNIPWPLSKGRSLAGCHKDTGDSRLHSEVVYPQFAQVAERDGEAEKLPQREKANIYNETSYTTSGLGDDQTVAWGQGTRRQGPPRSGHTQLLLQLWGRR